MPVRRHSDLLLELVADDAEFEVLTEPVFRLTEGPLWDARGGFLLFTDIPRDAIYGLDAGGVTTWRQPSGNANGLTFDREGRLHACESMARRVTRTEHDGSITVLADRCGGRRLNAPNDVVVSSAGHVYFTDPATNFRGPMDGVDLVNGVYLVPPGAREPILVADDFDLPNGLCLSPDERILYVDDTVRREIRAFDVRPDGQLANDRTILADIGGGRIDPTDLAGGFGEGVPDGIKVDERGTVYCTGPGGIWIVAPHAEPLGVLELPRPYHHARNLNWGGPDWTTLFVCASDPVALLARVFRIELRVRGAACYIS